nr:LecD [Agrobacterium fabrum]
MYLGEIVEIEPRQAIFENVQYPKPNAFYLPSRLLTRHAVIRSRPASNDELKSPIRPADLKPPVWQYSEVLLGHCGHDLRDEWEARQITA